MARISTENKIHKLQSEFYISVVGSNNKVLFDTMGGYRLLPLSRDNSEFERKFIFLSYDAAVEKIHKIQKDAFSEEVRSWNFQVLEVEHESISMLHKHEPIRSSKDDRVFMLQKYIKEFEEFYTRKHKSWDLSSMAVRRNTSSTGYDDENLQKAFEAYLVLIGG